MTEKLMLDKLIKGMLVGGWQAIPFFLDNQVVVDSRQCNPGDFFIALSGDRFDGHNFLSEVAKIRASGAMIEENVFIHAISSLVIDETNCWWKKIPIITVPNTRQSLIDFAYAWRRQYDPVSIIVIGSNGKTTVKEMIASICREAVGPYRMLASKGNFNNSIGLPLSLLRLRENIKLAVFEIGMNHPGETILLAKAACPDIVVINNAQREHQEHMKTVYAVAVEHASAISALDNNGVVVIPSDDLFANIWRKAAGTRRVIEFSLRNEAVDCRELTDNCVIGFLQGLSFADEGSLKKFSHQQLKIYSKNMNFNVNMHIAGKHSALNALAAASVGLACNLSEKSIQLGLENFRPVSGRLQQILLTRYPYEGIILIDDSYNANPDSVRAAIDVLCSQYGKRIMVFGDMGEVGQKTIEEHNQVGRYAAFSDIDVLFTIGRNSFYAWEAFRTFKKNIAEGGHFTCYESLLKAIEHYCILKSRESGLISILVKGSHFMEMNKVINYLSFVNNNKDYIF